MNYRIEIVKRSKAEILLSNNDFVRDWTTLANMDQKNTVIQEPPFVITWHNQYKSRFDPILLIAYDEKKNLIGIMPLAFENKSKKLVHAGAWQAEYHGWIAIPDIDNSFPVQALISIQNMFDLKTWQWNFMPPKSPIDWIESPKLKEHDIFVVCESEKVPVWDLSDKVKLQKLRKNKTIKNLTNRYKRQGEFYIERIREKNKAKSLLNELKYQTDFRQKAVHNILPFSNDPYKEKFFIDKLNYPNSFHFTVLWASGKPIAFHHGVCSKSTIILGLTGFDPTEAKNSPSTLLLTCLAELASEEGFQYIDMTPGSDAYKKRFSNIERNLYRPKIYFSKIQKVKESSASAIKKGIKFGLNIAGKRPDNSKNLLIYIKKSISRAKRITIKKTVNKVIGFFYEHRIYYYYNLKRHNFNNRENCSGIINKQRYSDLLKYTESNPWLSLNRLLSDAMNRFSSGDVLYSIIQEDVLTHWGWLTKGGKVHRFTEVDMTFRSPPNSYILYDFYTEPKFRKQKLYQSNLYKMIEDSFNSGAEEVFIGVAKGNIASKKAIEHVGFTLFRTFSKRKVLFFTKKQHY